jgi:pyridoxamine 5'-phosphate oxidase
MHIRKSINNLRREYKLNKLSEETVQKNPFRQFENWFKEVIRLDLPEQNAMMLATASSKAKPTARVVLLKDITNQGFKFFTNYKSAKAKNILENSSASLLFYWAGLERQIRIEGKIKKLSKSESLKYFDSRPYESRIAAWASEQSKIISDRKFLELQYKKFEEKFSGKKITLPPNWGGYILEPNYFEFWQGRENRLHDRICYKKQKGKWKIFRLAP